MTFACSQVPLPEQQVCEAAAPEERSLGAGRVVDEGLPEADRDRDETDGADQLLHGALADARHPVYQHLTGQVLRLKVQPVSGWPSWVVTLLSLSSSS